MLSWEFLGRFLEVTNTPGIRIPIPYHLAYPIIKAVYTVSRWILKEDLKVPSIFVPCRFVARFKPFTCSFTKTDQLLDGIQTIDLKASFEELRESLKHGSNHE